MILKPLNEIEWADIVALRDSGREEDDTIEYKSSFSGGSDYLSFTDSKRDKAIEGIAREAIAFLNGRGGDIVIGVKEAANDHPKIEEITPVDNIDQTVDRLAQSLAAQIEPTQSVMAIRAVRNVDGDTGGVIVVRCQSSLRAPHRFKPNNVSYVRRGRECVPMPMDEVQDLTLRRDMNRREILGGLDRNMASYQKTFGPFPDNHVHIAFGLISQGDTYIEMGEHLFNKLDAFNFGIDLIGSVVQPNHIWTHCAEWVPMVRGAFSRYVHQNDAGGHSSFRYWQREVHCDGTLIVHIADSGVAETPASRIQRILNQDDLNHAIASALGFLRNGCLRSPGILPGILRTRISCKGQVELGFQGGSKPFFEGEFPVPDLEILELSDFDFAFQAARRDFYNLAGMNPPFPCNLVWDK